MCPKAARHRGGAWEERWWGGGTRGPGEGGFERQTRGDGLLLRRGLLRRRVPPPPQPERWLRPATSACAGVGRPRRAPGARGRPGRQPCSPHCSCRGSVWFCSPCGPGRGGGAFPLLVISPRGVGCGGRRRFVADHRPASFAARIEVLLAQQRGSPGKNRKRRMGGWVGGACLQADGSTRRSTRPSEATNGVSTASCLAHNELTWVKNDVRGTVARCKRKF